VKAVTFALVFTAVLFGQGSQPVVTNAKFESRASSENLADVMRSDSPQWFGYAAKAVPRGDG
jgi:hypothetical protein